jgi:hypothetical protein
MASRDGCLNLEYVADVAECKDDGVGATQVMLIANHSVARTPKNSPNMPSRQKTRPWVTALAVAGTVAVATVGVVFGSVGAGIAPDGQFIPCGPPIFGRDDSRWDRRCRLS